MANTMSPPEKTVFIHSKEKNGDTEHVYKIHGLIGQYNMDLRRALFRTENLPLHIRKFYTIKAGKDGKIIVTRKKRVVQK